MHGDFFDTNVLLYAASANDAKAELAAALIETRGHASVQVLNEFVSVARGKMKLDWAFTRRVLDGFRTVLDVRGLDIATHELALDIAENHQLHIYDATIAASAFLAGCDRLLTEDMHHGLVIGGQLTIENPFRTV